MRRMLLACLLLATTVAACGQAPSTGADTTQTLEQARAGADAALVKTVKSGVPLEEPPAGVLEVTSYTSPAGELAAYITPRPAKAGRYPAVIWISGGDFNTIGDFWSPATPDNDQTASAFRRDGIVVMYPSLRGGNTNPGSREGFYGEVDDVAAAADHLKSLDYVDPQRIYLAGHSTGGTLVMLASEYSDKFRASFAFGPVADPSLYASLGADFLPIDPDNREAIALRSPILWLNSVRTPLFVLEGADEGNMDDLITMKARNRNPLVNFIAAPGYDHFSVLAPATALIAQRILADTGAKPAIALTDADLARR